MACGSDNDAVTQTDPDVTGVNPSARDELPMDNAWFQALDEEIDHYSERLQDSFTLDPLTKSMAHGGV